MKVFAAGATGAIGHPLIEQLVRAGHEVTGLTRSAEGADRLQQLGAEPALVDIFDQDAVRSVLERAKPSLVIDTMTSLPKSPAELGNAQETSHGRRTGSANDPQRTLNGHGFLYRVRNVARR
jgi:2-alkyl-3-oxoalkanoate reductase